MRPAHQGRLHQTGVCPQQSQQKLHLPSRHAEVGISYIRTGIRSSKRGSVLTINVGRNEGLGGRSRDIRVPKLTPGIFEFLIEKGKDEKAHTNKAREDQETVSRMRNGRMSEVESRLLHKSWHVVVTQAPAFSVARAWRSSPSSLSLLFIDRIALPAGRMMRPAR